MSSKFRSTWTHKAGQDPAKIIQGYVVNVNVVNWTVDVRSQFDRHRYFDIAVGSPYMHFNSGEGIYAVPEVGARCMIAIPGDSSAPFVMSFIMPFETVDASDKVAQDGSSDEKKPKDASFAGGRPRAKLGDIYLKGRDGNFVVLHRGGVLQIGATELAQRIFIPLGNLVTDVSGNYAHHNMAGAVLWGIQEGESEKTPAYSIQTYRVFAGDEAADVRIFIGKVDPLGEPESGYQDEIEQLEIGKNEPIICEVAVAKTGFTPGTGRPANDTARKESVLRFMFDRAGNTMFRCAGNVLIASKKKIQIKAEGGITIEGAAEALLKCANGLDIDGGAYTHIKGTTVRLGAGSTAVARMGDSVQILIPPGTLIVGTAPPGGGPITGGMVVPGQKIIGFIMGGNTSVLA